MVNVRAVERDQQFLMPPSVSDWLPEDHFAWFVIDLVAELDLAELYASLRADGRGGAAYHPEMMLGVLLYAYCVGGSSVPSTTCSNSTDTSSPPPEPEAVTRVESAGSETPGPGICATASDLGCNRPLIFVTPYSETGRFPNYDFDEYPAARDSLERVDVYLDKITDMCPDIWGEGNC